ncbi:MAG: M23 family metallopeptidase [Desulfobacterales bacterium]|nr:M23 family metallopeptidase [Desulfobacterales bacterium]
MAKVKRIKKRYTFLSLLIVFSVILAFNLLFSSSSKTEIIKSDFTNQDNLKYSQATQKDISKIAVEEIVIKEPAVKQLMTQEQDSEPDYIIKHGSINKQPIYCELRGHEVTSAEILKLSKDFEKVFNFKRARKGDKYTLFFSKDNQLKKILYKRDLLTQYVAKKNDNDSFDVTKRNIVLTKKVVVKEFILKDSLFQAILDSQEKHSLAFEFAEIFSWDIDFFLFPRKGDKIQIKYEKLSKDGAFVKYGKILAARYIAKEKTFSAFLFNDGKYDNYYDENGKPLRKMFLRVPIKLGRITSSFSLRRFHPVLKKYRRHTGIDYGSSTGTPIFATANGKVKFAGWAGGYGKLVTIVHPNGYETYYGHCSKILVKPGKFVNQGDVIAKVGSTGHATGPHVHYEIRINRKPVNPNAIKFSPGKSLAKHFLPEYKALVSKRIDSFESAIKVASSSNEIESKS